MTDFLATRLIPYTFTTLTVLHCLGTDIGGTDQTAGMHSGIEKQICYLSFEQCNIFFYLFSESDKLMLGRKKFLRRCLV